MIEREFIKEKIKHMKVKEFLDAKIGSMAGLGSITIEKTPLGEKIIVEAEILHNTKKLLEAYAKAVTMNNVLIADAKGKDAGILKSKIVAERIIIQLCASAINLQQGFDLGSET